MGHKRDFNRLPAKISSFAGVVGLIALGAFCRLLDPWMDIGEDYQPLVFTLRGTGYQFSESLEGPGEVFIGWDESPKKGAGVVRLVARLETPEAKRSIEVMPRRLEMMDNSIHFAPKKLDEKVKYSTEHSFRVTREEGVLVVLVQ